MEGIANLRWVDLARMDNKRELYTKDPFFREGWERLFQELGERAYCTLFKTGLIVIRPEAIAFRKADICMKLLEKAAMRRRAARAVLLDRLSHRCLYSNQLSRATAERLELQDVVNRKSLSLVVLVEKLDESIPTSVLLTKMKDGRADPSLRKAMGAFNRVLTMVHTSDEPADVLREGTILLGASAFCSMVVNADTIGRFDQVLRTCYESSDEGHVRFIDGVVRSSGVGGKDSRAPREGLPWNRILRRSESIAYESPEDIEAGVTHYILGRSEHLWELDADAVQR